MTLLFFALTSFFALSGGVAIVHARTLHGVLWLILAGFCAIALFMPQNVRVWPEGLALVRVLLFIALLVPPAWHFFPAFVSGVEYSGTRLSLVPLAAWVGFPGEEHVAGQLVNFCVIGAVNLGALLSLLRTWGRLGALPTVRKSKRGGADVVAAELNAVPDQLPEYVAPEALQQLKAPGFTLPFLPTPTERLRDQARQQAEANQALAASKYWENETREQSHRGLLLDLQYQTQESALRACRARSEVAASAAEVGAREARAACLKAETAAMVSELEEYLRSCAASSVEELVAFARQFLTAQRDRAMRDHKNDLAAHIELTAPLIIKAVRAQARGREPR